MRTPNSECAYCSLTFYKSPSQKHVSKHDFCSVKCYSQWRKAQNIKKCEVCEIQFHPKRREQRFCSVSCCASRPRRAKWNGAGKSRPDTFKNVFLNKGWDHTCMISGCNYSITHDLHRLVPGKSGGRYRVGNAFLICPNHHAEVHREFVKLRKIDDMTLEADYG